MLDFAAKNHIKPQIEMIGIDDVADAYQNILDSKVHYRYVIDMATLKYRHCSGRTESFAAEIGLLAHCTS